MSELTQCNFCRVRDIKRRAKKDGMKVTLMQDCNWGLEGTNIYVHPPEVNVRKMEGGEDGPRSKYRVGWAMSIGSSCSC